VPSFLKRMSVTPEAGEGPLAERFSVRERLLVEVAPPLMDIVSFGTTVSTNQLRLSLGCDDLCLEAKIRSANS
jgi:hypothetical protein